MWDIGFLIKKSKVLPFAEYRSHIAYRIHKLYKLVIFLYFTFLPGLDSDQLFGNGLTYLINAARCITLSIVKIFKKKVNKVIHRVKIVKQKIVHFKKVYKTAPVQQKPVYKKKIQHFTQVYKKLIKKIVHMKRTIRRISKPVPKPITKKDIQKIV